MAGRTTFEHALRGLRRLPHVGEHPGVPFAFAMILIGAAVGAQRGGATGALLGITAQALWVLPLLLIGSVDRSRLSDRIDGKCAPLAQQDRAADF